MFMKQGMAKEKGVEFILPTDVIVADKFAPDAQSKTVPIESIPEGWMVLACCCHAPCRAHCCMPCMKLPWKVGEIGGIGRFAVSWAA